MSFINYSKRRKPAPSSASESNQETSRPAQAAQAAPEVNQPHPDDSQRDAGSRKSLRLSKTQRYYLLKALITIQMAQEGSELEKLGALTLYGSPFSKSTSKSASSANGKDSQGELFKGDFETSALNEKNMEDLSRSSNDLGEPLILRQMFHKNLLPFPGLSRAPKKYWTDRIQVFFDEMAARNFSTSLERSEMTKRHFFLLAGLRYLSNFFNRGVGVRGDGELRGPGRGVPGSEKWEVGKKWGKGTVKRGLSHPIRPDSDEFLQSAINSLFSDPQDTDPQDKKSWELASKEVQRIRINWCGFKESIIEDLDGLDDVIKVLDVSSLNNIPKKYRYAEEFVRIHVAFILHTLFITSEDSDSIFNIVKGFNTFFPWLGARALLKFVNAGYVVEGILGLILARPLGAPSLLQRFMSFVINLEIDKVKKECQKPLEKEIDDKILCDKINQYVSQGDRNLTKQMALLSKKNQEDVLTTILIHFDSGSLDQSKKEEVKEMQSAFAKSDYRLQVDLAQPESSPVGKSNLKKGLRGSPDRKARKFAQLKLYLRCALRVRDHQQALKVASGTLVVHIIRDSMSQIFFKLIKDVASCSNLSGRLADLHKFLDDLIKIRNGQDKSLEAWIALCARHEQSLYLFVHECRSLAPQFLPFLQSALDFMALSTSNPLNPSDEKAPRIEVNLEDLLASQSSEVELDEILKEVDDLETFVKWQKVRMELELRKNFLLAVPPSDSTSQIPSNSVSSSMRASLQDIDSLLSQLMTSQNFKPNQGDLFQGGRGSEQMIYDWAWFDEVDLFGSQLTAGIAGENQRYKPKNVSAPLPQMIEIRKLLPAFRNILKDRMPDYLA